MRALVFTFAMLSGLSLAAAQDDVHDEDSTDLSEEHAEEERTGLLVEARERRSAEELILTPTPEEIAEDEAAARALRAERRAERRALREERQAEERGPYRRRRRRSSAPVTLSREARYRRDLNLALDANSLTLPLAMFFGGAAGAVGFGYGAVTCHTTEEYDPTVGEIRCTEFTTLNLAFLLLTIACNSITIGSAIWLIGRGIRRRMAYREYLSRSRRLSLNPSGLELRF